MADVTLKMVSFVKEMQQWMTRNFLKLIRKMVRPQNSNKMEELYGNIDIMLFGSIQQLLEVPVGECMSR